MRGVAKPIALSTAYDIRAYHVTIAFEGYGEKIEISRVAREAMHADHHMRIVRITPFGVGKSVKAMGAKAQETVFPHF